MKSVVNSETTRSSHCLGRQLFSCTKLDVWIDSKLASKFLSTRKTFQNTLMHALLQAQTDLTVAENRRRPWGRSDGDCAVDRTNLENVPGDEVGPIRLYCSPATNKIAVANGQSQASASRHHRQQAGLSFSLPSCR